MKNAKTQMNRFAEKAKELNDEETQHLKRLQLEILDDVVNVCDASQIMYKLAYGTLLGAVRHKGYIPWDDDIDLFMDIADMPIFAKRFKETFGEKYRLAGLGFDDYGDPNSCLKIILNGTELIEIQRETYPHKMGINIDIWAMVPLGKSRLSRFWKLKKTTFEINKLSVDFEYRYPSRLASDSYFRFRRFIGFFFHFRSLKKRCDRVRKCFLKGNENFAFYGLNNTAATYDPSFVLSKEEAKKRNDVLFEGRMLNSFVNNDIVLKALYGDDYMVIPDKSKREKHILVSIDFGEK